MVLPGSRRPSSSPFLAGPALHAAARPTCLWPRCPPRDSALPAPAWAAPGSRCDSHVFGDRGVADGVSRGRDAGLAAVAAPAAVQTGHVHAVEAVVRLPGPRGGLLAPVLVGASVGGPAAQAQALTRGRLQGVSSGARTVGPNPGSATYPLDCGQVTRVCPERGAKGLCVGLYLGTWTMPTKRRGPGPTGGSTDGWVPGGGGAPLSGSAGPSLHLRVARAHTREGLSPVLPALLPASCPLSTPLTPLWGRARQGSHEPGLRPCLVPRRAQGWAACY